MGAAVLEETMSPRTTVKVRIMLDFIRMYKGGYISKEDGWYKQSEQTGKGAKGGGGKDEDRERRGF
jgi:hypothetical protein